MNINDGGGGFTAAQNLDIPLEEGNRLEALYKELHPGVYEWGNANLKLALDKGYIESEMGFKLRLPEFDIYKSLETKIKELTKDFWGVYRIGKEEYKAYWIQEELNKKNKTKDKYVIQDKDAFELYKNNKKDISRFFQLKSQYFRLCLNNPIQASASHQVKLATSLLFEFIEENNHFWDVRIANIPHD